MKSYVGKKNYLLGRNNSESNYSSVCRKFTLVFTDINSLLCATRTIQHIDNIKCGEECFPV